MFLSIKELSLDIPLEYLVYLVLLLTDSKESPRVNVRLNNFSPCLFIKFSISILKFFVKFVIAPIFYLLIH